ncbi:MAG TPA: trypsin-like peptidase domain-containing protein, partial [Luteolibacter sp.]|nr:trypsin-like peptidase domain-containing protein [Luteolibacter sp.]
LNDEYARLTRAVVPSVVSINTEKLQTTRMRDFWGRTYLRRETSNGQGSGVIVSREGHVLTNYHVIAGQEKISVTLHGGKMLPARIIGEDQFLDIAVLRIEGGGPYEPLPLGDSSKVEVGQMVFAIGNPFGLGETVTQGIISAKERSLSDTQRDLFQTDAAINPGNSGGPLVNLRGEIIGINVAIFSPDKENPGFQGVGFSIPSNDARDSLEQILKRGRPVRGYLGVQMRDLDPGLRRMLQYDGPGGSVVVGVTPGSPAEQAGLKPGDVIQELAGRRIESYSQLFARVQSSKVGEKIALKVWREGNPLEIEATIAESSTAATASPTASHGVSGEAERILQAIGLEVRDLTVPERMHGYRGVVVTSMSREGLAARALRPGDLIVGLNGSRISSAGDFIMRLVASAANQDSSLILIRGGETLQVVLPKP